MTSPTDILATRAALASAWAKADSTIKEYADVMAFLSAPVTPPVVVPPIVVPPVVTPPVVVSSPVVVPAPADVGKTWQPVFYDDFSGTGLDRTKWTPAFSWAGTAGSASFNGGREVYQASQVTLSGGQAHLTAKPAKGLPWGKDYLSGLISTTNDGIDGNYDYAHPLYSFKYGYVEASLKLPYAPGMFSAFWMLPVETPDAAGNFSYPFEIDIVEAFGSGDPTRSAEQTVLLPPNRQAQHKVLNSNVAYDSGFHRYGVDWRAGSIEFFLDGKSTGKWTDVDSSAVPPMVLILDLMVDQTYHGAHGQDKPGAPATETAELVADYIGVWQQK